MLDDVWSARVVEAFTVGCPLLVTTRDDSVVNDMHMYKKSIHIDEGLTLNETQELFASVLKIPEQELPPAVEEIWMTHRGTAHTLSAAVLTFPFQQAGFSSLAPAAAAVKALCLS